jgi:hypothetical protein
MKQQSPWQRLKQLALWEWGAICIVAGVFINLLAQFAEPPPKDRAEALGRACASLFFIVIGVVLIAVGLVKRAGRRDKR